MITKHSMSTLLLKSRDDIITAMRKSELIIAVFLDFYKTFDIIDYSKLRKKLYMNFIRHKITASI